MRDTNEMELVFDSISVNEGFARVAVAAFMTQLNPTLEEVADVKTAVSEAVTNAIIHGYRDKEGVVTLSACYSGKNIEISVSDNGVGIADVEKAMEPLYTSQPELERSGMGFTVMETFMDFIDVISAPNEGTKVILKKKIGDGNDKM